MIKTETTAMGDTVSFTRLREGRIKKACGFIHKPFVKSKMYDDAGFSVVVVRRKLLTDIVFHMRHSRIVLTEKSYEQSFY